MKIRNIYITTLFIISGVSYGQHLTLEQCKQQALENNRKIKNSLLETNSARELKKEAYTKYFPQVSANALGMQAIDPLLEMNMPGGDLPVYDGNPANLGNATQFAYMPGANIGLFNQMVTGYVNVVQPLYAGNKIKTGNRLAALNIEVKEQQQQLSENEILLKTEQQYWQVVSLQEKQKTLDSYIQFLDKLYEQVNNAYKNGLIIKNDLLKVSIKQSELKVNKTQLENGKKLSLMQLCKTIGIEYNSGIVLQGDLVTLPDPQAHFVSGSEVLPNRAEYKLLEMGVKASELETRMNRGNYLPTVGVGFTGYYLDQLESNVDGVFNGMVYASVTLPISDWWGGKHKLKELKFKEEIAKNTLEDNKELLNLQIEKAWTDLNEAAEKIELIEETLEQTVENLKVNQDSYNNGIIQLSDLLEAQALKTETQDRLIEAKSQYRVALTNYLQVTGR